MPHVVLEYSSNVADAIDDRDLFRRLHEIMAERGPFALADIKSRAVASDRFYVADGDERHAFVHLEIRALEGRDPLALAEVGDLALGLLRDAFPRTAERLACQFTVEIREMARARYFKSASDAPGPITDEQG
jgi:5-carboxymethyl-2-hydroxymuconate isomerase